MRNWKKSSILAALALLATAPPVIFSYEYGPDPGYTGAPGDNKTGCQAIGCHTSTPNSGPGSLKIVVGSGATSYTPGGPALQVQVIVTDSTKNKFGFELTARIDGKPTNDAGTLAIGGDGLTQVVTCANPASGAGDYYPGSCGNNLHWIEHTEMAFLSPSNQKPGFTYTFMWTPPATDVGPITFYAGGNAGLSGAATPDVNNTDTYLTQLHLTAASGGGNAPTIASGGVTSIFGSNATVQPGSWISIKGTNLITGATPANWNADFPITLGGTSVTINNKPAYLWYASPTQLNVEAPDDGTRGTVNVVVTTSAGSGNGTVTLADAAPSFQWIDGNQHVLGIILRPNGGGSQGGGTYDLLGPNGNSLGFPTVAAKAGDTVALYGVGFGPTKQPVPAGQANTIYPGATDSVDLTINNAHVTAAAAIWFTGAFQINVTIPPGLGAGDQTLIATVNGVQSPQVLISLQ